MLVEFASVVDAVREAAAGGARALRARNSLGRVLLHADGRSEDPVADSRKAIDLARRALQVAGDDPGTLANATLALSDFGEDIGAP